MKREKKIINLTISNNTQKLIMEFFLKYSIPKILKDNE